MVARVLIDDGVPFWLSPSIVPSTDLPQSIVTAPTLAAVSTNSGNISVYVKVENTGTVDLGNCTCPTGAWTDAVSFPGADNSGNVHNYVSPDGQSSIHIDANAGDTLTIGGNTYPLSGGPIPAPHYRAWGWSPDGRFLGYVRTRTMSMANSDWKLSIFALQSFTDGGGTMFSPGQEIVSSQSTGIWSWTNYFFRWVGSNGVLALGPNDSDHPLQANNADILEWHALCPSAPAGSKIWGMPAPHKFTNMGGAISKWTYFVSPCGLFVAFAANMSAGDQAMMVLLSVEDGVTAKFKKNNVDIDVSTNGPHPLLSTNLHTANGVTLNRGDGNLLSTIQVDDPDCTAVPTAVRVEVDRVLASTLPSANMGVQPVGYAWGGPLLMGQSKWVQVPNYNGWANMGQEHWCLLAQAFTMDGTIPKPWTPPASPFPVSDENCAQRNIMISP